MCSDCNSATYNMSCIDCVAHWILRMDKYQRLTIIEQNGKHDVNELKQLIIKLSKGMTR